jgi:hypothetical protein
VAGGGGVDSMHRFRLERGDDVIKHYRKMKWMQRARLRSMERKCDTAQQHGDIGRRRGGIGRGKGGYDVSWADVNLTGPKNKEKSTWLIHLL